MLTPSEFEKVDRLIHRADQLFLRKGKAENGWKYFAEEVYPLLKELRRRSYEAAHAAHAQAGAPRDKAARPSP